jgi:DNA-binding transcriptional MerR regulator
VCNFPRQPFASGEVSADDVRVRTLKTSEAAALLNVSPNTLRAWERRVGYPKPQRSAGRHRLYTHGEVAALRDALQQGLSISSAVSRAREALSTDTHTLVGALAGFELDRADSAMESALALRSVERSVEEVLLPSLDELGRRFGIDSAPWAFAARWANGWLRRAQRLAPPPVRRLAILVGDATRNELDPDALSVRAFELFCGRAGARVMALPVGSVSGLSDVVGSLQPDAVVIAGSYLADDDVALWAYRVRATAGPVPMALFRSSHHGARVRTTGTRILPATPFSAHRQLLALIDDRRPALERTVAPLTLLDADRERRGAQA